MPLCCRLLQEVFGNLDKIGLAAANGLYLSMPDMTSARALESGSR